jgi:hypothetical protein
MTQLTFETELKYELDWHTQGVTEEEYEFICEQASYMSDRDRIFFMDLLRKIMRAYQ